MLEHRKNPPLSPDRGIVYKSAATHASTPVASFVAAPPPRVEGAKKIFAIPVGEDDADAFYAKTTGWAFALEDRQAYCVCYNPADAPCDTITVSAVAHRDPVPKS